MRFEFIDPESEGILLDQEVRIPEQRVHNLAKLLAHTNRVFGFELGEKHPASSRRTDFNDVGIHDRLNGGRFAAPEPGKQGQRESTKDQPNL